MRRDAGKDQAAEILAELSQKNFSELRERDPLARWRKYLDFEKYVPFTVNLCRNLELIGSPRQSILDIGCGSGLFLYCARHFGHEEIGIDIEDALLGDMAKLFGVDRRIAPVLAFQPIDVDGSFDLITCMGTLFDRTKTDRGAVPWSCAHWAFFLRNLGQHLSGTGRVFLRINRGKTMPANCPLYDEELFEALRHGHLSSIAFLFDRAGLSRAIGNLDQIEGRNGQRAWA